MGTIASGVAKAGADVILISGYDGGTGAAPISSIHHAGLPWEVGLAEAHACLVENGLRDRVILETDGKLMSGRDVAIAALLGAEEFGFATAPLVCMGCMMMRVCSKDTCPAGIATQNAELRKRFAGQPEQVMNFMLFIARQLREIMASLGFKSIDEMVGRSDLLRKKTNHASDRAGVIDLSYILSRTEGEDSGSAKDEKGGNVHFEGEREDPLGLNKTKDVTVLLPAFSEVLKKKKVTQSSVSVKVSSTDRSFGTILGSEVTGICGNTLSEDTLTINAEGGGGQSFGAFIPKGITIRLKGDANDGFGKGLSGGKLIVTPPDGTTFKADENVIVGNVALYGATGGKAYFCGVAGERFCVRNSGAVAVSEGCGDHGLEYMTGGKAVILGLTGKNFAAGMSGGTAYVLDREHTLYLRTNKDMVSLTEVTEKYDVMELKDILTDYVKETGSELGKDVLDHFEEYLPDFKKVVPNDYHRMQSLIGHFEEQGIPHEKAVLEAFEEMCKNG